MLHRSSHQLTTIACLLAATTLTACGGRNLSGLVPQSASNAPSSVATADRQLDAVTASAATGSYAASVLALKPLAYYRLNDGGTTLADAGSAKLNGTYGNGVRHRTVALTADSDSASATFDGNVRPSNVAGDAATVTANAAFETPQHTLTVEAWIKPAGRNVTSELMPLVSYGREAQGQPWVLQINPQSDLNFWIKTSSGPFSVKSSTTTLLGGQLYQVAATYDGGSIRVYINGALEGSAAANGTLDYRGISPQFGLALGGALGSSWPIFNGAMSDVAVYPSVLSASQIQQHYVNGHARVMLTETPAASDAFVDSIGVVTHLSASSSRYATSWSTFLDLLKKSGIRHVADSLVDGVSWYTQHLQTLAQNGIRSSLNTKMSQSAAEISAALPQFAGSIESIAGPNEPDDQGDANWVSHTRTFQQMLWSTVKANPSTANITVLGPPLVNETDATALGDLSAYMDRGNMHDYFNGNNPGTAGWGSTSQYGTYGAISTNRNLAAIVSGSKPVIASETGYGSASSDTTGVDGRTLTRYVPRVYLEHFLNGIPRTTMYEFYDDNGIASFQDYGLVRNDNTPKPSYTVLKNLIALLADPGPSFTTTARTYSLGGDINHVHHLLLQRRNGSYELVMWLEVPSYNPAAKTDISVPSQSVTVQPSSGANGGTVSTFDDNGNTVTTTATYSGGVFTVPVDDRVTVLTVH